jgi:hypothetical protein
MLPFNIFFILLGDGFSAVTSAGHGVISKMN